MTAISADYFKALLPAEWRQLLAEEFDKAYFLELVDFLNQRYQQAVIYPPAEQIFTALRLCPPDNVKVIIIGQDPYHGQGQANGLAFSVAEGIKIPPSLRNILKEVGEQSIIKSGDLTAWAEQGVLLLNNVLSVEAGRANSHRNKGWEQFTTAILSKLAASNKPLVLLLWGKPAAEKAKLFDATRHLVLTAPHPSPLSAYRGFFGCGHFDEANRFLEANNLTAIQW